MLHETKTIHTQWSNTVTFKTVDLGCGIVITDRDMRGVCAGMPVAFEDAHDLYDYLHTSFRAIRRFSDGKPFKENRDATDDAKWAVAALIWARNARENIFRAVYSHYR